MSTLKGPLIKSRAQNPARPSRRDTIAVFAPSVVALSVLAFLPGGLFRFALIKIVVILLALACGLAGNKGWRVPGPIVGVLVVGALTIAAGIAVSGNAMPALLGRWPRYEGALTMGIYVATLAMGAKILGGPASGRAWQWLHRSLAGAALLLALLSALEALGLRPLGGAVDLRPGATLGNATDQGLVAVLIVGVLALPALSRGDAWRWFLRAGLAAAGLTAVLSGSRAALLGLLLVIVVIAAFSVSHLARRTRFIGMVAGAALAAVALAVFFIPASRDRLFSGGTVSGRWLLWQQTLEMARDHPWLGVGANHFVDFFPGYQTPQWTADIGNSFPPDSPHMVLLQALVVGGLPLLLLLFTLTALVIRHGFRNIRAAANPNHRDYLVGAFAALAAFGAGLLTHFSSPATTPLALMLCGALIAVPPRTKEAAWMPRPVRSASRQTGLARITTVAAAAAIAVALALMVPASIAEWPMAKGAAAAAGGQPEEADKYFEQARVLRPWDGDTSLLAAQAFAGPATNGDADAAALAVKWAERSLGHTPKSGEAMLALSIGHIYSGDLAAGKAVLDGLIVQEPNLAAPYIQRGIAEFGLGNVTASLKDLARATELTPEDPLPQKILAQVRDRIATAAP